jgi:hypothetical protein
MLRLLKLEDTGTTMHSDELKIDLPYKAEKGKGDHGVKNEILTKAAKLVGVSKRGTIIRCDS